MPKYWILLETETELWSYEQSYEQKRTSAVLKNAQKSHLLKPESRECFLYIALNLPGQWGKIKLNVYFHTSLWCLKGFMKALIFISIQLSEMDGTGRVKICFSFFSAYEVLK